MWCTIALTSSLIFFALSWRNMRDTKDNLRDAEQLLDRIYGEIHRETDRP